MSRAKKYRSDKGFTLIELLVAMAIVALLSSVTYVGVSQVKQKAYVAKARLDLDFTKNAVDLFYRENSKFPPLNNWAVYFSGPESGWDTFGNLLGLSLPSPAYESIGFVSGNRFSIDQGYSYVKSDALVGRWALMGTRCLLLYDGYVLNFGLPEVSSDTLNDGGIDPWGLEYIDGQFTIIDTDRANCHF
ncbi:type II secretion system GspH family protein [Candidatus Parcubacteria bacterium]|nr:type II secretion system GspH family protein [Candidatus Parcubacteria bacterium]